MTTKEQERKALEQIKKIVGGLGAESYIGKAFEGCFLMAQENIEDDFWNSWKDKCQHERKEKDEALKKADKFKKEAKEAMDMVSNKNKELNQINARFMELCKREVELREKVAELEDKQKAMELENMKLKAKLYDMIVNEGE